MAKITGTVKWIKPVVANGNTAWVFTLQNKAGNLAGGEEMFDATFVAAPLNRRIGLVAGMGGETNEVSDFAVKMCRVEKGSKITVETRYEVEAPISNRVTSDLRVDVCGVEFENDDDDESLGDPLPRRRRGLPV